MKSRPIIKPKPKGPRFGKRARRAVIRLRHRVAIARFERWCAKHSLRVSRRPWRMREWHRWHTLGCP